MEQFSDEYEGSYQTWIMVKQDFKHIIGMKNKMVIMLSSGQG